MTPTRAAGDFLIDFDFGGSGVPALNIHRWIISGTASTDCEASNTLPCWNKAAALGANAEASVNSANVTDDNPPGAPRTLVGEMKTSGPGGSNVTISSTFGEAGINLSDSNIFPQNECAHFGSAYVKSRSAGQSFTSELKDFIAPVPVNISNCGQVIIRKVTDPAGDTTTDFGYTTDVVTAPATTTSPFSLKDGEDNTIDNVLANSYNVTEDDPSGDSYELTDIDCDASTVPDADIDIDVAARTVDFDIDPNETLDCTFTNTLQVGALVILKQSTKTGNPLVSNAGAEFSVEGPSPDRSSFNVTDDETAAAPDEDDDAGEVCVSGLSAGDYTINEVSPPDGYGDAPASDADQVVTVVAGTNCDDNLPAPEPPRRSRTRRSRISWSGSEDAVIGRDRLDDRLRITVRRRRPTDPGDTPMLDVDDLEPQTIICTIDIDP